MIDLQLMKRVLNDRKLHLTFGKVKKVVVESDRSRVSCFVSIFPEEREIVTGVGWPGAGPDAGIIMLPQPDDLVIVGNIEGEEDDAFIISRLSSKVDTIPQNALDGSLVLRALAAKKAWLTASRINLSKGNTQPTEPLVLGNEMMSFLEELLDILADLALKVSTHTHIGNIGYPTSAPNESGDFTSIQSMLDNLNSSPVQDGTLVSDIAFTEKGS